jgi:hypothetical protein
VNFEEFITPTDSWQRSTELCAIDATAYLPRSAAVELFLYLGGLAQKDQSSQREAKPSNLNIGQDIGGCKNGPNF